MQKEQPPLLTIVCLCHNHERYVENCLDALKRLDLTNKQVILVDDGSDDQSKKILSRYAKDNQWEFIDIPNSIGNCKAFNKALERVSGEWIVDLATDDELIPTAFEAYTKHCQNTSEHIGFHFANAVYINEIGITLNTHFTEKQSALLFQNQPSNLFQRLFEGSFICPPTVVFSTAALKAIGGYDENLSFEDFDAWMRIARKWKIGFYDGVVIKKRLHSSSSSFQQTRKKTAQFLESVHAICQKAISMSESLEEQLAVAKFAGYHFRLAFFTGERKWAKSFWETISSLRKPNIKEQLFYFLSRANIHPTLLYHIYQNWVWKRKNKL